MFKRFLAIGAIFFTFNMVNLPAIAWHASGATVIMFGVAGGANEISVTALAPFHTGQIIRLDSETMVVVGFRALPSLNYMALVVARTHRAAHIINTPVQIAD